MGVDLRLKRLYLRVPLFRFGPPDVGNQLADAPQHELDLTVQLARLILAGQLQIQRQMFLIDGRDCPGKLAQAAG